MNFLFIGDIVGKPGRDVVTAHLPALRQTLRLDAVIANGENAAGGFGLTKAIADELFAVGVDVISTGNHWADQKEIYGVIEAEDRILRPVNYPEGHAGARRHSRQPAGRRPHSGDECDGPRLHGCAGRSLRGGGARTQRLPSGRGCRRHRDRCPCRGDQREDGHGAFLRRPRQPGGRHPHPCAHRGRADIARRHRLPERCRGLRRL